MEAPDIWGQSVRVLRLRDVVERIGLSKTTIWRLERAGRFPIRLQLSSNAVGWNEDDVATWLRARPRGTRRARFLRSRKSVDVYKRST